VVGVGLVYPQNNQFTVGVSYLGITGTDLKTGNTGMAGKIGVIDVEISVLGIVGMKGQAQQSTLTGTGIYAAADIQKWGRQALALRIQDMYHASLLHYKKALVARMRDVHWTNETSRKGLQLDNWLCHTMLQASKQVGKK